MKREEQMGTAGINLVRNGEVKEVVRSLDRFYCYNLAVIHWAEALANRLGGRRLSWPTRNTEVTSFLDHLPREGETAPPLMRLPHPALRRAHQDRPRPRRRMSVNDSTP
jgi:hypothetical protein